MKLFIFFYETEENKSFLNVVAEDWISALDILRDSRRMSGKWQSTIFVEGTKVSKCQKEDYYPEFENIIFVGKDGQPWPFKWERSQKWRPKYIKTPVRGSCAKYYLVKVLELKSDLAPQLISLPQ